MGNKLKIVLLAVVVLAFGVIIGWLTKPQPKLPSPEPSDKPSSTAQAYFLIKNLQEGGPDFINYHNHFYSGLKKSNLGDFYLQTDGLGLFDYDLPNQDELTAAQKGLKSALLDRKLNLATSRDTKISEIDFYENDSLTCSVTTYKEAKNKDDALCTRQDISTPSVCLDTQSSVNLGCSTNDYFAKTEEKFKPLYQVWQAENPELFKDSSAIILFSPNNIKKGKTQGYKTASAYFRSINEFGGMIANFYQTPNKKWHLLSDSVGPVDCPELNQEARPAYFKDGKCQK